MGWLERTEYPHFESALDAAFVMQWFTPGADELDFVLSLSDNPSYALSAMLLLKSFQLLRYFPNLQDVPEAIVRHVRGGLGIDPRISHGYRQLATPSRHRTAIRAFLGVGESGEVGRELALQAMRAVPRTSLTDFVNAAVHALREHGLELPAFSTLARLAREVRAERNRRLVQLGFNRRELSELMAPGEMPDASRLRDIAARALRRVEVRLSDYGRTRDRLRSLLEHEIEAADHGSLLRALCIDEPETAPAHPGAVRGRSSRRLARR